MKKYYYIATLIVFTAIISSCDKFEDFGDTNVDPSVTSSPIPSALLTNAQAQIGAFAAQTRPGLYCQYFSETQYTDVSLYAAPKLSSAASYPGILEDLVNYIKQNTDDKTKASAAIYGSNANQIAVGRIMKAYVFWTITDRWGDIPYSDALKGSPTITFDTQESVYKALITELTEAVAQFDGGLGPKGDVIYGGDVAKWKKAANSLRVLMSLRLSKKYPGANDYAATELKKALADPAGTISVNADNLVVNYPGGGTATFKSPWFNLYDGRKDFAESKTMTDLMTSTLGDARQSKFGSSAVGVPYGLSRAKSEAFTNANPNWAYILNPDLRKENGSVVVISAANVLLARAEAADRGWTAEDAFAIYKSGVNASYEQWGLAAPDVTYFDKAEVKFNNPAGTGANVTPIALQRYVALYPDGTQGWSEWRRNGVPVLTPAPDATNASKQIPRRYIYGDHEYNTSPDAVKAAVARIPGGVDSQDANVWWAQ